MSMPGQSKAGPVPRLSQQQLVNRADAEGITEESTLWKNPDEAHEEIP